jgi:streptogramin lyase
MNYAPRKLSFWMLAFCLMLTVAISPALATAQASSSGAGSSATPAASAAPAASGNVAAPKTTGKPSSSEIAAAKASGKVWVNTESGVYHKNGRWYGKTKNGKFMTEAEAKAAGYKEAQR